MRTGLGYVRGQDVSPNKRYSIMTSVWMCEKILPGISGQKCNHWHKQLAYRLASQV